jgi:hypothetical protein
MIKRLQSVDDQLMNQFQSEDLQPILENNLYHSPEDSENDPENPSKNLIVIKDLKWRSTTVSVSFLRILFDFILIILFSSCVNFCATI